MLQNKSKNIIILPCILLCCCLAACAVGPDYQPADMKVPDGFTANSKDPQSAKNAGPEQPVIDGMIWWKSLKDPELNSLVDRAIADNPDLEIALDRVQEARTQEDVVLGSALPEAGASFGGGGGTGDDMARGRAAEPLVSSDDTKKVKQIGFAAGFDSSWEIDLFGKYRREMEAAEYDTEATIAARNHVLISVIADIAHAYIDMRARQMRIAVLQKNIDNLNDYVKLTQEQYDRGITNELDVTLAQRQLASLEAEKAPLMAEVRAAQYVIATLLGKFPEDLMTELEKPGMLPALPNKIETGLPLDLLHRRPDIQEAEREVAEATANIGVAEADLFPRISVLGGAGIQGSGFGNTISPGLLWSVGPSVNWSLLDFGTLDALVDKADLRSKEMLVQYKKTVLNAVREVDGSIDSYKAQQDRLSKLGKALVASQRAVDLSTQRYERGLTDFLNVIDAERQEYDLEDEYVTAQQAAAEEFINLYKSMGGGWEPYQSFPAIRQPLPAVVAAFTSVINRHGPQKIPD